MRVKISVLGLICLLMLGSVSSAKKMREVNFWQILFPDPIERVYIILKDGMVFKYTSHFEDKIYMSMETCLKNTLNKFKNKKYGVEDIEIIIHNHLTDFKFSPEDRKQCIRLKEHGFNGLFLLYSHMTNKTYNIEEKEKSK